MYDDSSLLIAYWIVWERTHYALLKADCNSTTVENIAYNNGISHIGRFTSEYKKMYGERPYTKRAIKR